LNEKDGTPVYCGGGGLFDGVAKDSRGKQLFSDRAFAMIGRNYMTLERRRLLLPGRVMAIMMVGATEDANANFFPKP
jgi:hypothetical protein